MKKYNFFSCRLLLVLCLTAVVLSSCSKDDDPKQDEGVVINGVKWATRNVGKPGTFAAKPKDAGMFYQWNRKKAWPATGEKVTGWDNTMSTDDTWERVNDPCPAGWRVPTFDEIKTLFDTDKVNYERITQNGVNGGKFTDKFTGNSIFLPAMGLRGRKDGMFLYVDGGFYWSCTVYDDNFVCSLSFASDGVGWFGSNRSNGQPVRAVAE